LPNAAAIAWDADVDDYFADVSAVVGGSPDWPEGGFASDDDHPILFPAVSPVSIGGRELLHASAASFWIYDVDKYDDDHTRYEIPGDYFCTDAPSGPPLWTVIREGHAVIGITPTCRSSDHAERLFVFKRFTESPVGRYDAATEGTTTQRVWAGMVRGQAVSADEANIANQLYVLVNSPQRRYSGGRVLFDGDVDAPSGTNSIIHQRVVGGFLPGERPPGRPTESGPEWANSAHIAYDGFTWGNVGDAMELACELRRETGRAQCSDDPPDAESLRDLGRLQKYLECWANGMQDAGAKTVLVNLPEPVLGSLETSASLRGRHGEDLARVASGIVGLRSYPMTIQSVMRAVALDIEELRTKLHINRLQRDRLDLQKWANIANQVASCGAALASTQTVGGAGSGGSTAAAITCANSVAQVGFALATANVDAEVLAGSANLEWIDFRRRFADHARNLQTAAIELQKTTLAMQGGLASLEADRQTALRRVAQALLLDSDSSGRYLRVNTGMRRRYNTSLVRYGRAFDNAVHHAWQARRAVEQRLAMSLSEMRDPLGPMDPPSRWADGLCTMSGIDYTRIRSAAGPDLTDNYAGQFIGDYVTNLENVVNYYRSTYPHTREATTAVVSVRDDILGVRDECEVRVSNLLEESSYLDRERSTLRTTPITVPDGGTGGTVSGSVGLPVWERRGCTVMDGGVRGCVDVSELPRSVADGGTDLSPIPALAAAGVPSPGYRVTFGAASGPVSFSAGSTHIAQRVFGLSPGYYKVSWSGRSSTMDSGTALNPATVVSVRDASGSTATISTSSVATETRPGWWDRYHFMFQLSERTDVDLVIVPSPSAPAGAQAVDLAAFMLESASDDVPGTPPVAGFVTPVDGGVESAFAGGSYIATGQPGVGQGAACEDTDGSEMRKRFTRTCTRLCAAGWGSCEGGEYHCFYETTFDINVAGMENGSQFRLAQVAYGNFNYRSEEIGVNLVGAATRDCSESPTPSTCYGIGTAKYSLVHTGPFEVRNHRGDIYQAPLFDGVIESGPAIAAERYITNPLSSADRSLLDPNMMVGMRGRPMTGHYSLRIWDDEGFDFSQLADVQLVWNYSYWTRLGVH